MKSDLSKPFFPTKKSNMKKFIFPAIAVILLIAGAIVFSALHPAPKLILFEQELKKEESKYSLADAKFLNQIGFEQSKNVAYNLSQLFRDKINFYKDKYNLDFIPNRILDTVLKTTGLIIGSSHKFIGAIPSINTKETETNLLKLFPSTDKTCYVIYNDKTLNDGKLVGYVTEDAIKLDMLDWVKSRGHCYTSQALKNDKYTDFAQVIYLPEKDIQLFVVASQNDFNLTGSEIDQNKIVPKIKDPMILLKVQDGYVKLTSWN
jgi:hypothetical protein